MLIGRDLREIERLSGKLSKDESLALVRYFSALMEHKKTKRKVVDEQRRTLAKLSDKELRQLAKLEEET